MQKKPIKRKRRFPKRYPIDQCALYKIGSRKKLCQALGIEKSKLNSVVKNKSQYRVFLKKAEFNPFSLKTSKARQGQEPIGDLRWIHERILYLLEPVEVPNYSHAAVKQRPYRTNAAEHVLSKKIATFDLKNFYGATQNKLVHDFFLNRLRCPPDIARLLTKLTTFDNSMPTGSPLSPLLSLHAAKPMFDEIDRLAQEYKLIFTCYIDDLTFSGSRIPRSINKQIIRIINRYGYEISTHKTRVFGEHQAKHVTGIVIHKGKLKAPYSRFMTARNLESSISENSPRHGFSKIKLLEKKAGLLGETAYLDPAYTKVAEKAYVELKEARYKDKKD